MRRVIVDVATGDNYRKGQARLARILRDRGEEVVLFDELSHPDQGDNTPVRQMPADWPKHHEVPYAFKACALKWVADRGADVVLWMDSAVLPIRSLEPLWQRIEHDGYWFAQNSCTNYEQTADSAYPALFPGRFHGPDTYAVDLAGARELNRQIPHVIACTFGLNLRSDVGATFLREYYRLATETHAFLGPWINLNNSRSQHPARMAPCGPPDVLGHRHDQTAASVIAWKLGMKLTPGHRDHNGDYLVYPEWFQDCQVPRGALMVHDGGMQKQPEDYL